MKGHPPPGLWSQLELERAYTVATGAWPHLAVSFGVFAAYLTERVLSPTDAQDEGVQDLYLACACLHDVDNALRSFKARYFADVAQAVKRFDSSSSFADEVYQRLSDTLFVGREPGRGKIAGYSGRGPLGGFITTSAKRIALRLSAGAKRFQGEAELVKQFSHFTEQETALVKLRYRETFNQALSIALRQLAQRDRLVLRMNLVERVSTTRIATLYKVSQPTVSRWIQRTARQIFATVKDLVCDELNIDTRELESLLLVVRSQIEITLSIAGGAVALAAGQLTCDLSNGKTIVLHAADGPPFRVLVLAGDQPLGERRVDDRADLEAHQTIADLAERTGAPYEEIRQALARLASATDN